jgi:hypothetical protein
VVNSQRLVQDVKDAKDDVLSNVEFSIDVRNRSYLVTLPHAKRAWSCIVTAGDSYIWRS